MKHDPTYEGEFYDIEKTDTIIYPISNKGPMKDMVFS